MSRYGVSLTSWKDVEDPFIDIALELVEFQHTKIALNIVHCQCASDVDVNGVEDAPMPTSSHSASEKCHPMLYF